MQATRRRADTAHTGAQSERRAIESIFESYGLPGWLGWGTYGAESSYGATSSGHFFGLIENSYHGTKPNGSVSYDAGISAKLYSELVQQYGSVAAAVPHYSGNSYTVSEVEALGKGGGQGRTVDAGWFEGLEEFGEAFGFGGGSRLKRESENPLGQAGQEGLSGITGAISSISGLVELITSGEFWIRAMEIVAGGILLILGLKGLTGAEFPAAVPVPV